MIHNKSKAIYALYLTSSSLSSESDISIYYIVSLSLKVVPMALRVFPTFILTLDTGSYDNETITGSIVLFK